ncbi:GNAT family N-acetyltransferase [Corynebacterium accolens]|uniref:GNAT family N-acetyltransferase n=1 Tax=Corynebacterium accolens TaxID=38284 RepID=UPI00254D693C|nr:GNAT family N-acetyltransferase [Corynebacterium accolens]MDK8470824.1 GNAT family N-acetyltransferase [Corynebacterium accolens]MDK8616905.1 GNAT family N-acetyltransferase [Corynebacterium accolens]
MSFEIRRLTPQEFSMLAPQLVEIYIEAMGYDPVTFSRSVDNWRADSMCPGFTALIAAHDNGVVGVAYGFLGSPDSWWDSELRRALRRNGGPTESEWSMLRSYFEVAEVHVLPSFQGHGLGKQLLEGLLWNIPARFALLSTPEAPQEANGAFRLYRSVGFFDVVRHHRYPADPRPFAILGVGLPL